MSSGKSSSQSRSQQQSTSSSFLAPFQVPFLQALQGGITNLATNQAQVIGGAADALGQGLLGGGQAMLEGLRMFGAGIPGLGGIVGNLAGVGQGQAPVALPGQSTLAAIAANGTQGPGGGPLAGQSALQNLGSAASALLSQPNPGLSSSLGALGDAIQENLARTSQTIGRQASLGGVAGGSRQALATGLAAQEAQRQFSQGAAGLVSQDFAGRQALAPGILQAQLGAASQLQQGDLGLRDLLSRSALASTQQQLGAAGALNQGSLSQGGLLNDLLRIQAGSLQGAGQLSVAEAGAQQNALLGGLGSLGGLFNLGMAPFSAAFSPFLAAAQAVQPIILSQAQSTGSSRSESSAFDFALPGGPSSVVNIGGGP